MVDVLYNLSVDYACDNTFIRYFTRCHQCSYSTPESSSFGLLASHTYVVLQRCLRCASKMFILA